MKSYPGGKSGAGVYQSIINQIPPHETYIEPFLGSGAIMRHKRAADRSIGIEINPSVAVRARKAFPEATIILGDGILWLDRYEKWTGREVVYCDPPYMIETRRSRRRLYSFEFEGTEHERFLATVKRLPCMVLVSGYASELYGRELAGWRLVTFTGQTRGRPAIEHLWCNFPPPAALHDYRYLGAGFRERERITRKARRWRDRLASLAPLERQAVLSACLAQSTIAAGSDDRSPIATSDDARRRSPLDPLARSGDAGDRR